MIVLTTSTSEQTFQVIPRSYFMDSFTLESEGTGVVDTFPINTPLRSDYYAVISGEFNLIEGTFYILKVYNGSDVVYYDRIFCTDQEIDSFKISNNDYIQRQSDNDFVII